MINMIDSFLSALPNVVYAILLLVIAFIVAGVAKSLVEKLLKLLKFEALLDKIKLAADSKKSVMEFLPKLAYLVAFLLFLPGVLDKLGMQSVSAPIVNIVNSFLGLIPNLIGAGIILAVGVFLARLVRDLLKPVLKAAKIDALQEKMGVTAESSSLFSNIIANFAYGLILLLVIVAAIDQIGIDTIATPADSIVSTVFDEVPYVLAALIVITIGVLVANLVGKLLEDLLKGFGTDDLLTKITGEEQKTSLSKVIAEVVRVVIMIVLIVEGVNILKLPVLTEIGSQVIAYLPKLIAVVLIIALGTFLANLATSELKKAAPSATGWCIFIKVIIYVVVAFLSLSTLGIATTIVNTTFILIIAAFAVAAALAFGVGGREFASHMLAKLEKKIDDETK